MSAENGDIKISAQTVATTAPEQPNTPKNNGPDKTLETAMAKKTELVTTTASVKSDGGGVGNNGNGVAVAPVPTAVAPVPTAVAPAPTAVAPAPTAVAPAPTAVAPAPTAVAPAPTAVAPAPTAVAPAPTAVAPVATAVAPVPTAVAPAPTAVAPAPTAVTPVLTAVVAKPTAVAPTPTAVAPTPTAVAATTTAVAPVPIAVVATPAAVVATPNAVAPTPTAVATTPSAGATPITPATPVTPAKPVTAATAAKKKAAPATGKPKPASKKGKLDTNDKSAVAKPSTSTAVDAAKPSTSASVAAAKPSTSASVAAAKPKTSAPSAAAKPKTAATAAAAKPKTPATAAAAKPSTSAPAAGVAATKKAPTKKEKADPTAKAKPTTNAKPTTVAEIAAAAAEAALKKEATMKMTTEMYLAKAGLLKITPLAPPRDLTLGGHVNPKNKKLYKPNLNVQRQKNTNVRTSKDTTARGGRGGQRGERGAGRGRGGAAGGRGGSNLIQTTGVFSEGAGAFQVQRRTSIYGGNSDRYDPTVNIQRPVLNKSLHKIDVQKDEEYVRGILESKTANVDEEMSTADENLDLPEKLSIDDRGLDSDNDYIDEVEANEARVNLARLKTEMKLNDETTLHHKQATEARKAAEGQLDGPPEYVHAQSVKQLLDSKTTQIFLMQLPDVLPYDCGDDEDEPDPKSLRTSIPAPKTHSLNEMEEGRVGKIVRYKSGCVKMILGESVFDLRLGLEPNCVQHAIAVNHNDTERSANITHIGPINAKVTVVPDIKHMLYNKRFGDS